MVNYLQCKWQAEWKQDCGCDTHLADIFGDHGNDLSKQGLKAIPLEFPGITVEFVSEIFFTPLTSCFIEYNSPLLNSYLAPAFHPPAV